ncbi:MAG: hypothetical protein E7262_05665 [Lachnospiraceae bacterium]|nr:hypothetical protein [Lachnospiraceae bacterium]
MGIFKSNRIKIISVLIVVILVGLFMIYKYNDKNQGYRTISITDVYGKVSVVKDKLEYSAYPGMKLQEGQLIVTSADSYVRLVLDNDKYIKLEQGSRIELKKLGRLGSGKTSINLERGSIINELVNPLKNGEEYVVNTPNAVLAVRGTFFRVDLKVTEKGETNTDVYTYGGKVASKRIMPNGNVIDEEVMVEAGYKTTVNMGRKETIYVVEHTDKKEKKAKTTKIKLEEISDEDMVDIYFASDNGHELFIEKEEIEEKIQERDIKIEEHTSAYEAAKTVIEEKKVVVKADDSVPLVIKEENKESSKTMQSTNSYTRMITDGGSQSNTFVYVKQPDGGVIKEEKKEVSTQEKTDISSTQETQSENKEEIKEEEKEHVHVTATKIVEATCTKDGSKTTYCSECNETLSAEVIKAKGHTDGEVKVTKEASCTADGTKTTKCSICGEVTKTEIVKAKGHTDGDTTVTKEATCILDGVKTTKCSTCGEVTKTEIVKAKGHVDGETKVTKEATCTVDGVKTTKCSTCGEVTKTEIVKAKGHVDGEAKVTEEAKCTVDGVKTTKCSVCDEVIKTETIKAKGHIDGETKVTKEAKCTVDGVKTTTCTVCGEVTATESIPAKGHTEANGGTEDCHKKCVECGEKLSIEHTFTDGETIAATCTGTGKRTYMCDCGYSYTESIAAKGHTEINGGTANCHKKCSVCGVTTKTGHTYSETVIKPPTCSSEGESSFTCACGYSETRSTNKAPHNIDEDTMKCDGCNETFVKLDSTVFTDSLFLELVTQFDTDSDNYLSSSEINAITEINIVGSSDAYNEIASIEGIQNFTEITKFKCTYNNQITNLMPLKQLTKLGDVEVTQCGKISEVDLSGMSSISNVKFAVNDVLERIDLSETSISSIKSINLLNNNSLTTLDASNCRELTTFQPGFNKMLKTVDLSGAINLTNISTGNIVELSSLNVASCSALATLNVSNTKIASIDLSSCTAMTSLSLKSTLITTLDVSTCTALIDLDVTNCAQLNSINTGGRYENGGITITKDEDSTIEIEIL